MRIINTRSIVKFIELISHVVLFVICFAIIIPNLFIIIHPRTSLEKGRNRDNIVMYYVNWFEVQRAVLISR